MTRRSCRFLDRSQRLRCCQNQQGVAGVQEDDSIPIRDSNPRELTNAGVIGKRNGVKWGLESDIYYQLLHNRATKQK